MLSSNQINYSNANSKLQATNVQAAIDELYGKSLVATSRPVSLGQYYFRETSAFEHNHQQDQAVLEVVEDGMIHAL